VVLVLRVHGLCLKFLMVLTVSDNIY
jgi:hypothetical protein